MTEIACHPPRRMMNALWQATKPGIIFGNLMATLGGFLLAARGNVNFPLLGFTLLGTALVIAAGCVFNNCIDKDIDQKMQRTQNRPIAVGMLSIPASLCYASILACLGFAILYYAVNPLCFALSLFGFIVYVFAYSFWAKRHSIHGTLIGSFSGAIPPVIGYCAVNPTLNSAAIILFILFSIWQMPHSYAIAIFRLADYQAANIPVLPVVKGVAYTKRIIVGYIILFSVVSLLLTVFHHTGELYFWLILTINLGWLLLAIKGYHSWHDALWAKRLFFYSILIVLLLSLLFALDYQ